MMTPQEILKQNAEMKKKLGTITDRAAFHLCKNEAEVARKQNEMNELLKPYNPLYHEIEKTCKKLRIPLEKDRLWAFVNPHIKQGTEIEAAHEYVEELFEEVAAAKGK